MILDLKELKNLHKDQLGTETEPRFRGRWESIGQLWWENPSQHEGFRLGKKNSKEVSRYRICGEETFWKQEFRRLCQLYSSDKVDYT